MANSEYNRYVGYFFSNTTKIAAIIFVIMAVGLTFPRLSSIVFPAIPSASATFDCDDSALAMYQHFQSLGIESTPIIGNLKMTGEAYGESNHVWLLVKSGDEEIAYDWGTPRFDRQHYEGYTITLDYLLRAVEQDKQDSGALAAAGQ
jgi:hypothetical protein